MLTGRCLEQALQLAETIAPISGRVLLLIEPPFPLDLKVNLLICAAINSMPTSSINYSVLRIDGK